MTIQSTSQNNPLPPKRKATPAAEAAAPTSEAGAKAAAPARAEDKLAASGKVGLTRLQLPPKAAAATQPGPPSSYPPGQGQVIGNPNATTARARSAMQQAGGVSYVGTSQYNSGREVSVYASPGFDPNKPFKVMVYAHGMGGDTANSMGDREHMAQAIEEANKRGENILLVMPKGPPDKGLGGWGAQKGEDMGKLTDEAIANFSKASGYHLGTPSERVLMGHSAGGNLVANAYAGPNPPGFDKVMLADSSYGMPPTFKKSTAGKFMDAIRNLPAGQRPQVAIVTTPGDTTRHANEDVAPHGVPVNPMPTKGVPYTGHFGVPSYMVGSFMGGSLGFSTPHW